MNTSQLPTVRPVETAVPSLYWELKGRFIQTITLPVRAEEAPLCTERMFWRSLFAGMLFGLFVSEILFAVL